MNTNITPAMLTIYDMGTPGALTRREYTGLK